MKRDEVTNRESFFDRQERIQWWNQESLFKARVLVVGAGALGNEVLKNLALLGVGHMLVIDFDIIEDSNLSRAVLFRNSDSVEEARKAVVAAERTAALNPNPNAVVRAIHGDVVWELGSGVYRHVDLVIGCLDNLEARLAVNLNCWRTRTPWIDGGMWELSGSVSVYDASIERACYECGMTPNHYGRAKQRYSCTNATVKTRIRQGYEPTTQTTSAIIASIQAQEAVKILHGISSFPGRQLIFNGASHFYVDSEYQPMTTNELSLNPNCLCHGEVRFEPVLEMEEAKACETTARHLLELVRAKTNDGDLQIQLGYNFVIGAVCAQCGQNREILQPLFKVRDTDAVCPTCKVTCPTCGYISVAQPDCPNCEQQDISELRLEVFHTLSEGNQSVNTFLDYTLSELGIPPLHIITIKGDNGRPTFVELSGDLASVW